MTCFNKMLNKNIFMFLAVLSFAAHSSADISRVRVIGGFGIAKASLSSGLGSTTEGPLGFSVAMDYLLDSQWELGTEHIRTYSDSNGSAIGLTGVVLKDFFRSSHPLVKQNQALPETASYIQEVRGYIPYVAGVLGVAQTSIIDQNLNVVGLYIGGKFGADWPLQKNWGLRTEGTGAFTLIGNGSVMFLALQLGFYYYL